MIEFAAATAALVLASASTGVLSRRLRRLPQPWRKLVDRLVTIGMAIALVLLIVEGLRGGLLSLPAILILLFLLVMAVLWASAAR